MKNPPLVLCPIAVIALLTLAGCKTNDTAIRLSQNTRSAVTQLGDAYVSDLKSVKSYEGEKERLIEQLRQEKVRLGKSLETTFEHILVVKRESVLREIMAAYDAEAFRIMSQEFWLHLDSRPETRDLEIHLRGARENTNAHLAEAINHRNDINAQARSIIAFRRYLREEAIAFASYRSSFAKLTAEIIRRRAEIEHEAHAKLADVSLELPEFDPPSDPTETPASVIEERIEEVEATIKTITTAQEALTTHLQEKEFNETVFKNVLAGFIGLESAQKDDGSALPLPDILGEFLGDFQTNLTAAVTKMDGEKNSFSDEIKTAMKGALNIIGVTPPTAPDDATPTDPAQRNPDAS